jgi:hypothetical protein
MTGFPRKPYRRETSIVRRNHSADRPTSLDEGEFQSLRTQEAQRLHRKDSCSLQNEQADNRVRQDSAWKKASRLARVRGIGAVDGVA